MFIQIRRQLVQFLSVVPEDLQRLLVLLLHQGDNLFILGPLIYILGHYKEDNSAWGEWQDKWYENDGMVNTAFAKAPFESKSVEYYDGIVPERGTWVNMPELINVEHNGVVGFYLTINKKVDMLDFFTLQTRYVQALK